MSLDAVRIRAEQIALTTLTARHAGVKLRVENRPFVQPTGAHWVDLKISPGEEKPAELAPNPMYHAYGVVNFTVLAPSEAGTATALSICESLKNAFRNRRLAMGDAGYLTFNCVTIKNRGTMNGFLAYGVMIEYRLAKVG